MYTYGSGGALGRQHTMGVCRFAVLLAIILSVENIAQAIILTQPQDATVVEGGDATFQCAGEENGTAVEFIWDFQGAVSNGSQLTGVMMVTVSGNRTQLTLSGVQREVNGATVVCSAIGSTGNVDSDPATITVQYQPTYSLLPNQATTALEGEVFIYAFRFDGNPIPTNFSWSRDGQVISSGAQIATSVSNITITSTTRSDSGVYEVVSYNEAGRGAANFTLDVQYRPNYTLLPSQPTTVLVGGDFTYSFGFEARPTPTNFTWSRDGQVISSAARIATSVSNITITSTTRSDSGVYEVVSYNEAGRGAANFTLDVQYLPQITNRASQTVLAQGGVFTFNCTSEPANPLAVDYSFQKDGRNVDGVRATVQGAVLTISSVQAGDGGNYSCSADNSVGRDTVYNNLIVPPSAPRAITVSGVAPFSATVSWQPPLEDGGAAGPLMYTVTLTNTLNGSDVTTFSPTPALVMELTDLRHSVPYGVQVVAGNEAGMGPTMCTVALYTPPPQYSAVSSPSPSYHDLQAMVMGFGVVSFIAILLLVVAIITAVVLYACNRKLKVTPSVEDNGITSNSHYDVVGPRVVPQPSLSLPPTLHPFEERLLVSPQSRTNNVNSVVLEENPAYRSTDVETTTETEESLYL